MHADDLPGNLVVPEGSTDLVVFAHGSGSSRSSPRNLQVAASLHDAGLGTLLFDLLTDDEARHRNNVFDIDLLAERLIEATQWLREQEDTAAARIAYFGASTGAAAALKAAGTLGEDVRAVVSRGGRPDLAGDALPLVSSPTLLIVGGEDRMVLELNQDAQRRLRCPNELVIVPGAGHLFEERGALDAVADHATRWFKSHVG